MPIPKKPGELREMIRDAMYGEIQFYTRAAEANEATQRALDAAMRAFAEYDPCFAKAAEAGEPTFTLRASSLSAGLVEDWASRCEEPPGPDTPNANRAYPIADAMRAWPNRKLPD